MMKKLFMFTALLGVLLSSFALANFNSKGTYINSYELFTGTAELEIKIENSYFDSEKIAYIDDQNFNVTYSYIMQQRLVNYFRKHRDIDSFINYLENTIDTIHISLLKKHCKAPEIKETCTSEFSLDQLLWENSNSTKCILNPPICNFGENRTFEDVISEFNTKSNGVYWRMLYTYRILNNETTLFVIRQMLK